MKKIIKKGIFLFLEILPVFIFEKIQKLASLVAGYKQKKLNKKNSPHEFVEIFSSRFIERYYSIYPKSSLKGKKFYNIGAGFQKSYFPYWSYIDLISNSYKGNNPDINFNLESLEPLPLPDGEAEIIYNSYLLEHISLPATKNLIHESFRVLKKGGVFHCRVHSCTYGLHLFRHGIVSNKIFNSRESRSKMIDFLTKNLENIDVNNAESFINGAYRVTAKNGEFFEISPKDSFLSYNGTSLSKFVDDHPSYQGEIPTGDAMSVYKQLGKLVDPSFQEKYPHTHNFQYIDPQILMKEMKTAGFSEVYIVDIEQSVAPPLWEGCFNNIHSGFNFGVEAIK